MRAGGVRDILACGVEVDRAGDPHPGIFGVGAWPAAAGADRVGVDEAAGAAPEGAGRVGVGVGAGAGRLVVDGVEVRAGRAGPLRLAGAVGWAVAVGVGWLEPPGVCAGVGWAVPADDGAGLGWAVPVPMPVPVPVGV